MIVHNSYESRSLSCSHDDERIVYFPDQSQVNWMVAESINVKVNSIQLIV